MCTVVETQPVAVLRNSTAKVKWWGHYLCAMAKNARHYAGEIETGSLGRRIADGVRIMPVYDRSTLIGDAVNTLWSKLIDELIVVGVVCMVFLFHLRSSLVAIISLPVGILCAFILMKLQGLNANIMSLGGIAIAIGAMVDGAIVMVENLHKHIEQEELRTQGAPLTNEKRWSLVIASASEVGPALFFSLLIIPVSFVPIFALEAQEGRLFSPLAYTKTMQWLLLPPSDYLSASAVWVLR